MPFQPHDLDPGLSQNQLTDFAKKADAYFKQDKDFNIYENDNLKIVKLYTDQDQAKYFLIYKRLGTGAFGEVSKGTEIDINSGALLSNTEYAIKVTDFSENGTVAKVDIAEREQETVHENNILKILDYSLGYSTGTRRKNVEIDIGDGTIHKTVAQVHEAIVAMPIFSGRDIADDTHKHRFSYGSMTTIDMAARLANDLNHLHEHNIVHSDLKPANVIWDAQEGSAKIIDFNRAKLLSINDDYVYSKDSSDKECMAPECFTDKDYKFSKAADIYAMGKILAEKNNVTLSKESIAPEKNAYQSYEKLMVKPFINRMMSLDDTKRPTAKECAAFFDTISKKMQYDIEYPDDKTRLSLSKKIIDLEVYANQLAKEATSASSIGLKLGLTTDKNKKYENVIETITLLTQALSTEPVDIKLVKDNSERLLQADSKAAGFASIKGRYQKMLTEMKSSIPEEAKEDTPRMKR